LSEGVPQGLKPIFSAWIGRPKAEALGYLEARAAVKTCGGELSEDMSQGLKPTYSGTVWMSGLKPGPISEARAPTKQRQVQMRGFFTPFRMTVRSEMAGLGWR
jgi:hypothetical protein